MAQEPLACLLQRTLKSWQAGLWAIKLALLGCLAFFSHNIVDYAISWYGML